MEPTTPQSPEPTPPSYIDGTLLTILERADKQFAERNLRWAIITHSQLEYGRWTLYLFITLNDMVVVKKEVTSEWEPTDANRHWLLLQAVTEMFVAGVGFNNDAQARMPNAGEKRHRLTLCSTKFTVLWPTVVPEAEPVTPEILAHLRPIHKDWEAIRAGAKPVDLRMGAGYYVRMNPAQQFLHDLNQLPTSPQTMECKMQSGKIGVYELIEANFYRDPSDMVESSTWTLLGYKGHPMRKDCDFREYVAIYNAKFPLTNE